MLIVLEGERPITWNKLYAGRHWKDRQQYADAAHLLVLAKLRERTAAIIPFECRVHITVRAYYNKHPQDPDNITAKLYIDGLVKAGLLHDDTMREVASVTTEGHIDKENPRVEIEIIAEET
jgi:Holliday junction resolvase RusA-like endonuclease